MRLPLAAVLALLVAGCAGSAGTPFAGTAWTLDRIVAADGAVTRGSGDERLTFGADGRLSLASCNQCGASYRLRGERLTVAAGAACTRRACADGQIELERLVQGTVELHREGAYLVIETADPSGEAVQLLFTPDAATDAP